LMYNYKQTCSLKKLVEFETNYLAYYYYKLMLQHHWYQGMMILYVW